VQIFSCRQSGGSFFVDVKIFIGYNLGDDLKFYEKFFKLKFNGGNLID